MSHFPDDKRGPPYPWDFRAPLPFGHHQGWPPMPMSMSHSNPYFSGQHMVHPHLGQWAPPNKLPQAHSQPKLALDASRKDVQSAIVDDQQVETVDLSAKAPPLRPQPPTIDREITSTGDVTSNGTRLSPPPPLPSPPPTSITTEISESLQAGDAPTPLPKPAAAQPVVESSPVTSPVAPKTPVRDTPEPEITQSEVTDVSVGSEVSTDCGPAAGETTSDPLSEEPAPSDPPTIEEPTPSDPTPPAAIEAPAPSVGDATESSDALPASIGAVESLPTVSSTSADVKPPASNARKKKRPVKKKPRDPPANKMAAEGKRGKMATAAVAMATPKTPKIERRGPSLRILGTRDKPITVQLVNGPKLEEESKVHQPDVRGPRNGLFSSTLSARYDAQTSDPTWVCVFCKKGPHYRGLGDLFGPYVISRVQSEELCDFSGDERDIVETQKRGGRHKKSIRANELVDHFRNMSKRLKRAKSMDSSLTMAGLIPIEKDADTGDEDAKFEVWIHELCVVWSPGVCLLDSRLLGLQEAVWHCHQTMCSKCGLMGANLGCIHRNCPNRSHYLCAADCGWQLPLHSFISTCHFHLQR